MKLRQVVDALAASGVTRIYGVLGHGNLDLVVDATGRAGMTYVAARHEAGAMAMADGAARATGDVTVCTVTQGPGLTNAVTALATATRAGSPVLLIAADATGSAARTNQRIDQAAVVAPTGAAFHAVTGDDDWGAATRAALRAAQSGCTVLNLPAGDMTLPAPPTASPPDPPPAPPVMPAPSAVAEAAAALRGSARPILLAGRGAVRSRARRVLVELAEATGAMLGTTLAAKGYFTGHPRDLGVVGGLAAARTRDLVASADLLIAFGARLSPWTTGDDAGLDAAATVVQCDVTPGSRASRTVDIPVAGDARACAAALLAAVGTAARPGWSSAAPLDPPADPPAELPDGLDPRAVIARLDAELPAERTVVVDGGHFLEFPVAGLRVPDPYGFQLLLDFGSIGLGIGAGVGAALARPARRTVLVVGDGGFLMGLPDLDTAVRHRVPLLVVVLNDAAYGAEYHHLARRGQPAELATFDTASLAGMASAMGAVATRIDTAADLPLLAAAVRDTSGPHVVDVRTSRRVLAPTYQR